MEDQLKRMEKISKMERKNSDLSDIVLEKSSKTTESTKKWILTIASAILLFLIVLLVMKMLKQTDIDTTEDNIANVGESVESINQDEQLKEKSDNLFKKEPILDESSETDEKFEEMVKKLKEQDAIVEAPKEEALKVETKKVEGEKAETPTIKPVEIVKEVKPKELQTIVQEPVPVITTPIQVTPPAIKKVKKPTKKIVQPKRVVKKPTKRISQTFAQTKVPTISGYFIQVGATAKSFPDKRFLKKIKNAGFDYIVHGVNVKGRLIKKVLVGPYSTKSGALNALPAVKANINPSAYIYRLK
jgi:DedD protein